MKLRFTLILILILCLTTSVFSSVFIGEDGTIVSRKDILDDDLYFAGEFSNTYGKVTGDVTGFCYHYTNEGEIDGSVSLFAREIELGGSIGQSARMCGQYVDVFGTIQKNLVICGQEITLDNDAFVGKNFDAFGDVIIVSGTINGDINLSVVLHQKDRKA